MSPYLTYLSALILDSLTLAELTTREIDQWYWICFSVNFFSPRAFKVNSCPLLLMRGLQDQLFFHYYLGGAESWVGCWSKPRWQERPPSSTFCPGPSGKLTKLPWVNFAGHHWRGWERGGERRRGPGRLQEGQEISGLGRLQEEQKHLWNRCQPSTLSSLGAPIGESRQNSKRWMWTLKKSIETLTTSSHKRMPTARLVWANLSLLWREESLSSSPKWIIIWHMEVKYKWIFLSSFLTYIKKTILSKIVNAVYSKGFVSLILLHLVKLFLLLLLSYHRAILQQ